jgi:threonine dehydratase
VTARITSSEAKIRHIAGSSPLSVVDEARELLKKYLPRTRLIPAPSLMRHAGSSVYLKLESELPTGSFKPRGALYALATNLKRRQIREVIASSTGNHGAAVAYAAKELKVPATIFLPENANPVKRQVIAQLGARLVERGRDLLEVFNYASDYASSGEGIYFLNDATDADLPAGPATIACEIVEQLPEVDTVYAPMGDTALIRGIAAALKQLSSGIRIVGVQAERAPAYCLSWNESRVVNTKSCDTIADGLATRTPNPQNVERIRQLVDEVRLVSDEEMLTAIRHLLCQEHVVAEPAGAATTAAILAGSVPGSHVVTLVTGSNIAPDVLRRALCQGGVPSWPNVGIS